MKEEIIQNINQGLEAAYINGNLASNLEYKPSFISNNPEEGKKVISSIEEELLRCEQFQMKFTLPSFRQHEMILRKIIGNAALHDADGAVVLAG